MLTPNVLRRYSFDINIRSSSVPALGRLRYEARYAHFVPRSQAALMPPSRWIGLSIRYLPTSVIASCRGDSMRHMVSWVMGGICCVKGVQMM